MGIFKDMLFPHERPNWSDKEGKVKLPRDSILLPLDGDWKWRTEWIVEIDNNFHDKKGWSYANDFNGALYGQGFANAQTRLFSMELKRRAAKG